MPNWCTNSVRLEGKEEHRQEFVDKNKGFSLWDTHKEKGYHDLSFNASVPCPQKHINSHLKSPANSDWFSWCNKNWGTKWEAAEPILWHSKDSTSYSFDTAWCSPVAWVTKVSKKFPHIKFTVEWAEEGGSGGEYMIHGGDCFYDTVMSEERWKSVMGYEEEEEEE